MNVPQKNVHKYGQVVHISRTRLQAAIIRRLAVGAAAITANVAPPTMVAPVVLMRMRMVVPLTFVPIALTPRLLQHGLLATRSAGDG